MFGVQLGASSPAIHGGAYFLAVCRWKSILISAPGLYKHRECYRLLFFPPGATFFCPLCTCTLLPLLSGHFKWICAEAGHMDLSDKQIPVNFFRTNPFEMPKEQQKQVYIYRAKKSCSWWKNKQPIAFSVLIQSWSTNQNWFSPTSGRENGSSVYRQTRLGELYVCTNQLFWYKKDLLVYRKQRAEQIREATLYQIVFF